MAEASREPPEVAYHGLRTKPFRENTDPAFLWLGPPYRVALNTLRAAVLRNAGVLLLIGEVGVGKTMLARALADRLAGEGVRVAKLGHAPVSPDEFRNGVVRAFGIPAAPDTRETFVTGLGEFLRAAHARGEKLLLIIDEAQNLDAAVLDEVGDLVRVGCEAGNGTANVLNILLVGQSGIEGLLRRRKLPGGGEFVAARAQLRPLDVAQVADYVAFRLRAAGGDRELFSVDAIAEVAAISGGVPRLINQICDRTLVVTSPWNGCMVSAGVVRSALGEMDASTVSVGRRLLARSGVRRALYAISIALAIGLGVLVYHAGRGSSIAHAPAQGEAPSAGASSVAVPPAATEPAATSADTTNATNAPNAPNATNAPSDSTATSSAAPDAASPNDAASRAPTTSTPTTSSVVEPRAVEPRRVDVTERSAPVRPTPPREDIVVKPRPKPVVPPQAKVSVPTPPPVMQERPEPTPPSRNAGAESAEDPSAIINWLLQRNPAAER